MWQGLCIGRLLEGNRIEAYPNLRTKIVKGLKKKKTKRVKLKKNRGSPEQQTLPSRSKKDSWNYTQSFGSSCREICDFEHEILVDRLETLEAEVERLYNALLEEQRKAKLPVRRRRRPSVNVKKRFASKLSNRDFFLPNESRRNDPTIADKNNASKIHDGHNLLPTPQKQQRVLRRCSRRRPEKCNFVEYHTTVNPIVMYFVCAFMICMMRMMRITVSYYICPVIDDWRDILRRRLTPDFRRFLLTWNVRF